MANEALIRRGLSFRPRPGPRRRALGAAGRPRTAARPEALHRPARRACRARAPTSLQSGCASSRSGGVVRRRKLPPPAGVQRLRADRVGPELEPIVTRLGAWGARSPFPPDSRRSAPTRSSSRCARCSTPRRRATSSATYELRLGERPLPRRRRRRASCELSRAGGAGEPTAAIETDPGTLAAVLTGQLPLDEALGARRRRDRGRAGGPSTRFLRLFPMPRAVSERGRGAIGEEAAA